jgi:transposase
LSCPTHHKAPDEASVCPSYGGRPEKHFRRLVLDVIFYVVRGGIAWRQMPHDFPPATTVYDIFRCWTTNVVWQRIHDALRDLAGVIAMIMTMSRRLARPGNH